MIDIDVYKPENVDFTEFAQMQKDSFKDLLKKMGVSDAFMTPAFYQWKYNGPFGAANLIIAKEHGRIIASTVNQALQVCHREIRYRAWQNGDSAMLPEYRGKGLYGKCVAQAVSSMSDNEIIYGFPNKNSHKGFSAHVPVNKGIIPLLAAPSIYPVWASSKHIAQISKFRETPIAHTAYAATEKVSIEKSREYLAWRYEQHPVNQYCSFYYDDPSSTQQAVVVTRKADIGGKKVLVIMELIGNSIQAKARLLRYAIYRQRTGVATLMFNNSFGVMEMFQLGFVKVPNGLLPKTQILFVHAKGDATAKLLKQPWQIQMGDWDGF